jgi:hypothetical protein
MKEQLLEVLNQVSHTQLSAKFNLHAITLDMKAFYPDEEIPDHLKAAMPDKAIFIFSKGFTMGVVILDTYYVKPEFFKGGARFNVFMQNETQQVIDTYKLKQAVPINQDSLEVAQLGALSDLIEKNGYNATLEDLGQYREAAAALQYKLQNTQALELVARIDLLIAAKQKEDQPGEDELILDLEIFTKQIQHAEDPQEALYAAQKGKEILAKVSGENERVKACAVVIQEILSKAPSGGTMKKEEAPVGDADREQIQAEFNALIKRGDSLLVQKKFEKAEVSFNAAAGLMPDSNIPKERLTRLNAERQAATGKGLKK